PNSKPLWRRRMGCDTARRGCASAAATARWRRRRRTRLRTGRGRGDRRRRASGAAERDDRSRSTRRSPRPPPPWQHPPPRSESQTPPHDAFDPSAAIRRSAWAEAPVNDSTVESRELRAGEAALQSPPSTLNRRLSTLDGSTSLQMPELHRVLADDLVSF